MCMTLKTFLGLAVLELYMRKQIQHYIKETISYGSIMVLYAKVHSEYQIYVGYSGTKTW